MMTTTDRKTTNRMATGTMARLGGSAVLLLALLAPAAGCENATDPLDESDDAIAAEASSDDHRAGRDGEVISRKDIAEIRDSAGNRPQRPSGDPMQIINDGDLDALLGFLYWERNPDWQDETGLSLLARAATIGNRELVETLIRYGADVNARVRINNTALHWAVRRDQFETAKVLLVNGADPNVAGGPDRDMTPRSLAHTRGDQAMIELLLRYGAEDGQ